VIPVKDGERYLFQMLTALVREGVDEILVIDSGSHDRSVEIARAAGANVLQIEPDTFGHGRTRNLGGEQTSGDLICFLTQDATPVEGWLRAYREAFAIAPRVGAAYGPHLPRADTSPMIARELEQFFAGFSANGRPVVQTPTDPPFLSNVNACYARDCWEEIRFRDLPYAEDQAFGRDLLAAGWCKVYHPSAAVLHAHDYGRLEFWRRYFDEYRGLREATGHVEPFRMRTAVRDVVAEVIADNRWMHAHRVDPLARARWTAAAAAHHLGRRVFSALGSRAHRLPDSAQRRLSLERRASRRPRDPGADPAAPRSAAEPSPLPLGIPVTPDPVDEAAEAAGEVWRDGLAQLSPPRPQLAERSMLRIAMVIPPFSRGSGGHNTLFQLFSRLERRGHVCTVWVQDYEGLLRGVWDGVLRHDIIEHFAPIRAPVYKGFDGWHGADVVLATGWQTAHRVLRLNDCYARAYLVNDHEPDFYPPSAERLLAVDTYRHGLHCIAASPWLRDLLAERYGASADAFTLGVERDNYQPREVERRRDTVVYYARPVTPRRAVPIGLLALAELHRRRPGLRIVLFGSEQPPPASFPYEHVGIVSPVQLSWLYSQATVGLCLSMTNFSLMPKEMLACGLPCVELAGVSAESIFGTNGPLELAPPDPSAIADSLERLLDDHELWERRSEGGKAFVASHTWDRATDEVEAGLRHALRVR
jgi:glycosyltransferase involved in cell wall biosynthesis/GT2 family glycosyltransferase